MSLTYKELQGKIESANIQVEMRLKSTVPHQSKEELVFKVVAYPDYHLTVRCIGDIIDSLRENNYDFSLYPAIFTSLIVEIFTDLDVKDEEGEIDIELICALDDKYRIIESLKEHDLIAPYIFRIEQNVWRQIDMDKQRFINYGANSFFDDLSDILYLLQDKFLNMDTNSIPEILQAVDKITKMNKVFNTNYEGNKGKSKK